MAWLQVKGSYSLTGDVLEMARVALQVTWPRWGGGYGAQLLRSWKLLLVEAAAGLIPDLSSPGQGGFSVGGHPVC